MLLCYLSYHLTRRCIIGLDENIDLLLWRSAAWNSKGSGFMYIFCFAFLISAKTFAKYFVIFVNFVSKCSRRMKSILAKMRKENFNFIPRCHPVRTLTRLSPEPVFSVSLHDDCSRSWRRAEKVDKRM
jgi:hypothetical protein